MSDETLTTEQQADLARIAEKVAPYVQDTSFFYNLNYVFGAAIRHCPLELMLEIYRELIAHGFGTMLDIYYPVNLGLTHGFSGSEEDFSKATKTFAKIDWLDAHGFPLWPRDVSNAVLPDETFAGKLCSLERMTLPFRKNYSSAVLPGLLARGLGYYDPKRRIVYRYAKETGDLNDKFEVKTEELKRFGEEAMRKNKELEEGNLTAENITREDVLQLFSCRMLGRILEPEFWVGNEERLFQVHQSLPRHVARVFEEPLQGLLVQGTILVARSMMTKETHPLQRWAARVTVPESEAEQGALR